MSSERRRGDRRRLHGAWWRRLGPGAAAVALGTVALVGVAAPTAWWRGAPPTGAPSVPASPVSPTLRIADLTVSPADTVERFARLDLDVRLEGSAAEIPLWPFDPEPPDGVRPGTGISVDAHFTDPAGRVFSQPAFLREHTVEGVHEGRDWRLRTGRRTWQVRFSPHVVGAWSVVVRVHDRSGTIASAPVSFRVTPSDRRGFVRVSDADPRYFAFDDGSAFTGLGFELPELLDASLTRAPALYARLEAAGVGFGRVALGSLFGSAWTPWIGGRNQYRGDLPVTGLVPVEDPEGPGGTLAMRLDHQPGGDTGWFDACRLQVAEGLVPVAPGATYRIRVDYRARGLEGPRDPRRQGHGLAVRLGGRRPDCHEARPEPPATDHGTVTGRWASIEGRWRSGDHHFLPRVHLGLENVTRGVVDVRRISLREERPDGTLGPELMHRGSMAVHRYVPELSARAFDAVLEQAERHGVYLKVVLTEKSDKLWAKLEDDGRWVDGADNPDGFYGAGRRVNKTRWIQQAWWRYAQARWGYSPHVHSWELTNEADPGATAHYEQADEFGKFMRCRVFGVAVPPAPGARCEHEHPNVHLVTTSLWSGLPMDAFWGRDEYPNLDYVDVHAYVSTSPASLDARRRMSEDAASFHLWHSRAFRDRVPGRPIVRGEAGLDAVDAQDPDVLGLEADTLGVWLHNFLWAGLDAGGLYEIYWWRQHIWRDTYDHRPRYATVAGFLSDLDLHRGGYVAWGGEVSDARLRVVGQRHPGAGRLHLWVQHREHTWRRAVTGHVPAPVTAEIVVPGFGPGRRYEVAWWNTYGSADQTPRVETATAGADGRLRLRVAGLRRDVALKVRPEDTAGVPPGGAHTIGTEG